MRFKILFLVVVLTAMVFGQAGLTGVTWRVQILNGTSVGTMTYTIKFTANDSAASGKIDCNSCGWRYKTSGQTISITGGFCSDMACAGPSRAGEFEAVLTGATTFAVNGSRLYLIKTPDTLAVFVDEAVLGLIGKEWQLQSIRQATGCTAISNPSDYTLSFLAGNSLEAKADCNSCSGTYTEIINTTSLIIPPLVCTKVGCGANSKGSLFTFILWNVSRYEIMGDTLFCFAVTDTLVFQSKSTGIGQGPFKALSSSIAPAFGMLVKKNDIVVSVKGEPVERVRLLDTRGKCMSQSSRSSNQYIILNTTTIPAGMYLLEVTGRSGLSGKRMITIMR